MLGPLPHAAIILAVLASAKLASCERARLEEPYTPSPCETLDTEWTDTFVVGPPPWRARYWASQVGPGRFQLEAQPKERSVVVHVDGREVVERHLDEIRWWVDDNRAVLVFEDGHEPPAGARVKIAYIPRCLAKD